MEIPLLEIFKWSWGAILPWMMWLHRKVDKVSEESIRREEFNGMVDSLRAEIRDSNHQITTRLDIFIAKLMEK